MKKVLLTAGAFALVGIGLLMADVKTDFDHKADFGSYKTYSWLKVDAGDSLWADPIKSAVDEQLAAKGLTKQPSGGSVSIAGIGRVRQEQTYTTFYDGLGGGWGWRRFGGAGLGTATTDVEETPVGSLTIDMFDSGTKKLIWRGTSTATLSSKPDKNDKKLQKDVADMFKKFPPKGES